MTICQSEIEKETWEQIIPEEGIKIVLLIDRVVVPIPGQPGNALLDGGRDNTSNNIDRLLKITR
jgi:hypothetical protein